MSKSFPNYDIDSVLKDATPFQVLDWFVKNMPAPHEPSEQIMFPEERVPRDIMLLSIMWGNAFLSLIEGCSNGADDIYRAYIATQSFPLIEAKLAIQDCVSVMDAFNFPALIASGAEPFFALDDDKRVDFTTQIERIDARYFLNGGLWGVGEHEFLQEAYQFVLRHLNVYRQRATMA